jgi:hypothetical protein
MEKKWGLDSALIERRYRDVGNFFEFKMAEHGFRRRSATDGIFLLLPGTLSPANVRNRSAVLAEICSRLPKRRFPFSSTLSPSTG